MSWYFFSQFHIFSQNPFCLSRRKIPLKIQSLMRGNSFRILSLEADIKIKKEICEIIFESQKKSNWIIFSKFLENPHTIFLKIFSFFESPWLLNDRIDCNLSQRKTTASTFLPRSPFSVTESTQLNPTAFSHRPERNSCTQTHMGKIAESERRITRQSGERRFSKLARERICCQILNYTANIPKFLSKKGPF